MSAFWIGLICGSVGFISGVIIICCLKLGKIRDNCMPGRMSELRPETEKIEVLIQGIENRDEDIERLTALAYERQEIIKEQVEEISKREHGWKLLYKEKEKLIERQEQENAALKKEAQDLHDKYFS